MKVRGFSFTQAVEQLVDSATVLPIYPVKEALPENACYGLILYFA